MKISVHHPRVALVTGSASGIGRATALKYARAGYKVVVSDVAEHGGQETVEMIEVQGGTGAFFNCDVSEEAQVKELMEFTKLEFNGLHAAFNNAGIDGTPCDVASFPKSMWDKIIGVNLTGIFMCTKYEIPLMLASGGGSIVNCSSLAGKTGIPYGPAYCAAKHGVIGITKTAALEMAQQGIRVNAVCPGLIDTDMLTRIAENVKADKDAVVKFSVPMCRAGTPGEVADTVLFLSSDAAAFITGQAWDIDGGYKAK